MKTNLPAEESKLSLVQPMNVQPLLTPKVSASFLAFEGVVWIRIGKKISIIKCLQG